MSIDQRGQATVEWTGVLLAVALLLGALAGVLASGSMVSTVTSAIARTWGADTAPPPVVLSSAERAEIRASASGSSAALSLSTLRGQFLELHGAGTDAAIDALLLGDLRDQLPRPTDELAPFDPQRKPFAAATGGAYDIELPLGEPTASTVGEAAASRQLRDLLGAGFSPGKFALSAVGLVPWGSALRVAGAGAKFVERADEAEHIFHKTLQAAESSAILFELDRHDERIPPGALADDIVVSFAARRTFFDAAGRAVPPRASLVGRGRGGGEIQFAPTTYVHQVIFRRGLHGYTAIAQLMLLTPSDEPVATNSKETP